MEEFATVSSISRPTLSMYFDDPDSVRVSTRERIEAVSDCRPPDRPALKISQCIVRGGLSVNRGGALVITVVFGVLPAILLDQPI